LCLANDENPGRNSAKAIVGIIADANEVK